LLGREQYDCTAGAGFRPGNVSAACGHVLATSGMAPLDLDRQHFFILAYLAGGNAITTSGRKGLSIGRSIY
jgi:hypothetical protein